jgi:hypothetical protein
VFENQLWAAGRSFFDVIQLSFSLQGDPIHGRMRMF